MDQHIKSSHLVTSRKVYLHNPTDGGMSYDTTHKKGLILFLLYDNLRQIRPIRRYLSDCVHTPFMSLTIFTILFRAIHIRVI
jgi:hypothetical protein